MNKLQHLLIKLSEEGSEIAQIALKTAQFGGEEVMPGQPFNNFQRCHQEIDDLMAVVEMLNAEHNFGYTMDMDAMKAKKRKVRRFLQYSINLGLVEGEKTAITVDPRNPAERGEPTFKEIP